MANEYNGRALPVEAFLSGGRVASSTPRRDTQAWVAERVSAGA
jgi:hypothetical protein